MPAVRELKVAARAADGVVRGYLRIALLPGKETGLPPPLIDMQGDANDDGLLAPIQLLEGHEYRYEWEVPADVASTVSTDPEEVFQPDTSDGYKGRLRPGLSTGTLQVLLRSGAETVGQLELEVRSRKLHYLSEYRWMLRNIADQMTELVMDRFAVSSRNFVLEGTRDAVTLYQRFAFLRALLTSEPFQLALNEITRRPHVAWEERHEGVRPGQSIRSSAHTIRQLCRPGARAQWPNGPVESIPLALDRRRTEATSDTTPNRFVRFALARWRQVIADIDHGLAAGPSNATVARGRREVGKTLEQLDSVLHHDLFKDLGPLTRFPADDQVLQRREGYRDVFRAYLEFELAAQLSWRGAESSFAAGQRDVATLYEYWAFIQLAQLVASIAGESFDLRPLIKTRGDGLNVVLQSGNETVLSGIVVRLGRKMKIELCFNRTFGRGGEGPGRSAGSLGSWTRPMRPDYSLIISAPPGEPAEFEDVVLHFDAKYRVHFITELFGQVDEVIDSPEPTQSNNEVTRGGELRADLLKMHAYRDAIRRSAGAYVLFPGEDCPANSSRYCEYQELLPGLGAFTLRPTEDGDAYGIAALRLFLDQVLDHVATRLTQHERGRYWLEEVYGSYQLSHASPSSISVVGPGPTTTVLLGYVKSTAHWNWIQRNKAYNVRTEQRPGGVSANAEVLYCQLLLLYCPAQDTVALARIISDPERITRAAMESTNYPNPSSDYLCVQLSWSTSQEWVAQMNANHVDKLVQRMGMRRGTPVAVTWDTLDKLSSDQ